MDNMNQGLDLAQPPGGYGPPPGGAPPGGWGPPGGPPPGGAPPGGWGPPGPPPGGAPPGGWGPPGGPPPGGAPPGGYRPPPGGAPPGGYGPPGGAPPGGYGPPPGGYGQPGGAPPGGYGPPPGGYGPPGGGAPPGGYGPPGGGAPPGGGGPPPGGYGQPPGGYGPPPGAPGYPGGPPGYPGGPPQGYPGGPPPGYQVPRGGPAFSPGDAITFAWERVKADPGTILATLIVGIIAVGMISFLTSLIGNIIIGVGTAATGVAMHRHAASGLDFFSPISLGITAIVQIINLVIISYFTAGMMNFSLKVARGVPYAFGDLLGASHVFLSVLFANLLASLAYAIGLVFLIVPGIIIALGLSMAIPLIVDKGLAPIEALTASWKLTDGHKGNLFIFGLIAFGLAIAGGCACGVGLLLVTPILNIAFVYIYLRLSGQPVAQIGRAV